MENKIMAKYAGLPTDAALLSALLEGLQMSRQRLDAQIATVRAAIAGEPESAGAAPAAAPDPNAPKRRGRKPGSKNKKKTAPVAKVAAVAAPAPAAKTGKAGRRKLSPAARKAIAAAQKRRWEEFRKNNPK